MAQQSARQGWDNQGLPLCFEHATGDLDPVRELPYRPAAVFLPQSKAGQMTASDHAQQRPQRFPLPERGRPQMVSGHPGLTRISAKSGRARAQNHARPAPVRAQLAAYKPGCTMPSARFRPKLTAPWHFKRNRPLPVGVSGQIIGLLGSSPNSTRPAASIRRGCTPRCCVIACTSRNARSSGQLA